MSVRINLGGTTVIISNTSPKSATVDLKGARLDSATMQGFRSMLAAEVGSAALRYDDKRVLAEVSKRIASRRWTQSVTEAPLLLGLSGGGEAAQPEPPPPAQGKGGSGSGSGSGKGSGSGSGSGTGTGSSSGTGTGAGPGTGGTKEPALTWIEIQILDEDGQPLLGETYEFKKTDGALAKGSTSGAALRGEQIPPGKCTLKLPDLHKNGWTAPGKTR
jgi:hypothetical protein